MRIDREKDPLMGDLFLAGQNVPPGRYRRLEGGRVIILDREDYLPASLDGRVACYVREPATWGEIDQDDSLLPDDFVFSTGSR